MTDQTDLYDRFLAYLQHHAVGSSQAKTAVTICGALALESSEDGKRTVRYLAMDASRRGDLVCSCQKGYFIPVSLSEALASTAPLKSQIGEMARRVRATEATARAQFHQPSERPRPALFALLEASA